MQIRYILILFPPQKREMTFIIIYYQSTFKIMCDTSTTQENTMGLRSNIFGSLFEFNIFQNLLPLNIKFHSAFEYQDLCIINACVGPHTRLSIAVELVGEIKARLLQKKRRKKGRKIKMSYVNLHVGGCHLMIGLIDRPTWCRWQTSTYFKYIALYNHL